MSRIATPSSCIASVTWLYSSRVTLIDEWPRRSCATLGCTPASRSWVAWLWRKSLEPNPRDILHKAGDLGKLMAQAAQWHRLTHRGGRIPERSHPGGPQAREAARPARVSAG